LDVGDAFANGVDFTGDVGAADVGVLLEEDACTGVRTKNTWRLWYVKSLTIVLDLP
jgi:hypothetical protein